jgi:hypothetical protein
MELLNLYSLIMWRMFFHILVALAILTPTCIGFSKVVRYYIDFEDYKKSCKNRDNSEISCNGLCRLSEELAAEGNVDDVHPPVLPNVENILPLFIGIFKTSGFVVIEFIKVFSKSFYYLLHFNSHEFVKELIKPPAICYIL